MTVSAVQDSVSNPLPIFQVVPDRGKHPPVALDRPVCVIGRDYDANLPLEAPHVSRHHALIVRDRSRVYLRDLASLNGVRWNGKPVFETELADDDTVRIASFTLRCKSGFQARDERAAAGASAADSLDASESASQSASALTAELRVG